MSKPDIKLVRALQADFKRLYVKEFTSDWQAQRLVRNLELGVMELPNTETLIRKAKIEELESLTYNKQMHGDWQQAIEDRIKSLTQEEK